MFLPGWLSDDDDDGGRQTTDGGEIEVVLVICELNIQSEHVVPFFFFPPSMGDKFRVLFKQV